ncbi:MAG TPA: hypothetical protein VJN89_05170 [Candidatus Acidoferrum sp.]|nr:hypothetical protein [Candidatus Acidoferrum sp.]
MFRSKFLWAIILGIATSILLIEARIHLGYNPWETRIQGALAWPGAHLVTALNTEGTLFQGWHRFWVGLSFACNLLIYVFVWYAVIGILTYSRSRKHPYDHENTMMPPLTR